MRRKIVAALLLGMSGVLTALFAKEAINGTGGIVEPNMSILMAELVGLAAIFLFSVYNLLKETL